MVRMIVMFLVMLVGCRTTTPERVRLMGERGDTDGLLRVWSKTDRESVRVAVINALALHPEDERGRSLVLRVAGVHESESVRLSAVRSLKAHEGPEVVEILIANLAVTWPTVRDLSREVLASKGNGAKEALRKALLGNPNHLVRATAARLLAGIAQTDPDERVVAVLMEAADRDDAPKVRESAVCGLGRLAAKKARALLARLKKTDPDTGVRMSAERALVKIGQDGREQVVVVVLPLKNETGQKRMARLGTQIAAYVAARLSRSKVCKVIDRKKTEQALAQLKKVGIELYDGGSPNAPEIGYFKIANQLVYGSVQKQGLVYTIVLNRMNVSTLELVPGAAATVSGYEADLGQLKVQVTDRFIGSF